MMTNKKYLPAILLLLLLVSCAKPIADFSYKSIERTAPAAVEFENNSQKAERYEWDFGDGNVSENAAPTHEYQSSGNYTVVLKAYKGKKLNTMEKRIVIDAPKECFVIIETEYGNMKAILYNDTPQHRDNFIKLAEEGYFDGLLFHRIINGFMIQGGDPKSKDAKPNEPLGSGGPGYTIPAEFVDTLVHLKGALAAARLGDQVNPQKNSSGSQFYIVQGREVSENELRTMEARKGIKYPPEIKEAYMNIGGTPFLDQEYTVFGRVVEGLDVIDLIGEVATNRGDRPAKDIEMKIRVIK